MDFSVFSMRMTSMPQCAKCSASRGSVTMSSSSAAYEYTSAPAGVIVPSLTASGYSFPAALHAS